MTYYTQEKEPTYLSPTATTFRTEALIVDATHMANANRYGEFSIKWMGLTQNDMNSLHEWLCLQLSTFKRELPYDSKKVVEADYEDKRGFFYSSQLFVPKLNVEYNHPDELRNRQATITLHLRDDPTGKVYIQVDYIDVDDDLNGVLSVMEAMANDDAEDDGW
jgi:hypothetical protein